LQSARNPKHPKAADVAYEASKCFAIGFGVSRDVVAMEYWLGEAARRGHEFASALVMTMSNSRGNSGHNGTRETPNTLAAHATTLLIKKHVEQDTRGTRSALELIQRSELFSFNSLAETESHFRNRISQGLGFQASSVLHFAAELGRIDLVQICLRHGADVNEIDSFYRCTPLVVALRAGQVDAAEILLRNGARIDSPNRFGWSAEYFLFTVPPNRFDDIITLFQNAPNGTMSTLRLLKPFFPIEDLDTLEPQETSLSVAAAARHLQAVRTYLFDLEYEFTVRQLSCALDEAVASHDATICEMILRKASISRMKLPNPFICITDRSIYDLILLHGEHRAEALHSTIEVLLSHGFDINSCEREPFITVMCVAVGSFAYGHEAAAALLDHGASLSTEQSCEYSVLQVAIAAVSNSDEEGCVRWVLAQGAPFTLTAQEDNSNDNSDPLYYACSVNAHGAAKAILDYPGADVNVICECGTPLHMACARDAVNMVKLLLENGADVSSIAYNGWTPLEMAVMLGSIDVVRLFLAEDLPLYSTHGTISRSILAFSAKILNSENTRTMQILLQHPGLRQPEVLGEIDEQGRTIVDHALKAGKLEFALDLLDTGAKMSNPHDRESGWRSLAYSPQRVQFYNAGDPQQICQYNAALEKAVQQMKSQDLIEVPDDKGETILHQACTLGSVGAVKVLLDAGALAYVAARDGTTPLSAALLHTCLWGSHIPEDWPTDRVVD
jgi:ankyrin repeat protein